MQKISTSSKKTDLFTEKERLENSQSLQPNAESLKRILQFAASYRAQEINKNQYIELYLN